MRTFTDDNNNAETKAGRRPIPAYLHARWIAFLVNHCEHYILCSTQRPKLQATEACARLRQTHAVVERVFNIIYAMMNTGYRAPDERQNIISSWNAAIDSVLLIVFWSWPAAQRRSRAIIFTQSLKIIMIGSLTYLGYARHLHLWDANRRTKKEQIQIQNSVRHWLLYSICTNCMTKTSVFRL